MRPLHRQRLNLLALAVLGMMGGAAAQTERAPEPDLNKKVRFASLRANEVNVRAGPGVRYPVKWQFVQRNMPVRIIAEFDTWRKIRDWEGAEGWVHRAMISSKRSLILVGRGQTLRRAAADSAPAVARLAPGLVVTVSECKDKWCEVEAKGYEGWIRRFGVWGLDPGEKLR
jgi:SH3-like domain-containing protein